MGAYVKLLLLVRLFHFNRLFGTNMAAACLRPCKYVCLCDASQLRMNWVDLIERNISDNCMRGLFLPWFIFWNNKSFENQKIIFIYLLNSKVWKLLVSYAEKYMWLGLLKNMDTGKESSCVLLKINSYCHFMSIGGPSGPHTRYSTAPLLIIEKSYKCKWSTKRLLINSHVCVF